eukprot:13954544-Alexandrium_andersonii.AAC.1
MASEPSSDESPSALFAPPPSSRAPPAAPPTAPRTLRRFPQVGLAFPLAQAGFGGPPQELLE